MGVIANKQRTPKQIVAELHRFATEGNWPCPWSPEGPPVAALVALADRLTLERDNMREAVMAPAQVLETMAGDWEDVALLLAAAAEKAGLRSRFVIVHREIQMQVREPHNEAWTPVGPKGSFGPSWSWEPGEAHF